MLTIKTPATSGNVGVGFDTLGIAFNLYNTFTFEESDVFRVKGFDKDFDLAHNLVIKAYQLYAKQENIEPRPVTVSLVENHIPESRGLGSSASCILAGVLAANVIHGLNKTMAECVAFAAQLEGHGDNVFACAYGSLTACLNTKESYVYHTYQIHKSLRFYVLIPKKGKSTKDLRSLLPQSIPLKDAVHNLSRMIFVPDAFKNGNVSMLKTLLNDQLHEPYRYQTIPHKKIIESIDNAISVISGSGPTMLFISKEELKIDHIPSGVTFKEVFVSQGVEVTDK